MRHRGKYHVVFLACMLFVFTPTQVSADVMLGVDSGWQDFNWGKNGLYNTEGAFTFTTATPVVLRVTDAFFTGDRFEIYNHDVLMALTSVPVDNGSWEGDPDVAFYNANFSSGAWALNPGSYSLTFKTISYATGYKQGTGYVRVDTSKAEISDTPEPGTLALLGLGMAGLAAHRLYRRRNQPVMS